MLKDRLLLFVWQHVWLTVSLLIMTLGVALCIRSQLGSSVISSIPLAFTLAGEAGLSLHLTVGEYTNLMNIALVVLQMLILRRRFQPVQLFQLIIGFLFGLFIDINMAVTSLFSYDSMLNCCLAQIIGCTVLGVGISMEIRCGSITMPGEGITVAISKVSGLPFPKTKIIVDVSLVIIAVILGYMFFGTWMEQVIGFGTLFAMLYVGFIVKCLDPHMSWFDRILGYRPGFRRYVYGLARYLRSKGIYR
ncbi:MAG: hypothetical protein K2M98_02360 [Muribaculum sp.]|nr:hypothetical protein [Muribaculum sp.]